MRHAERESFRTAMKVCEFFIGTVKDDACLSKPAFAFRLRRGKPIFFEFGFLLLGENNGKFLQLTDIANQYYAGLVDISFSQGVNALNYSSIRSLPHNAIDSVGRHDRDTALFESFY